MASRTETFDSEARYTMSPGTVELVNGLAQLVAPYTSGTLEINEEFEASVLASVTESATRPGGTNLKYQIRIDGTLYWWNGASWATSDGTITQANTTAEINAQAVALPLNANGSKMKIRAVFSGTALLTSTLDTFTVNYTLNLVEPTTPVLCRVHVHLKDLLGIAIDNSAEGAFWCQAEAPIGQQGALFIGDTQRSSFTLDTAYLDVPNTEDSGKKVVFFVQYVYRDKREVIRFYPCVVPNFGSVNLTDLTDPTSEVA